MSGADIYSKLFLVLLVSSCPTTAMNQVKNHDESTGARP